MKALQLLLFSSLISVSVFGQSQNTNIIVNGSFETGNGFTGIQPQSKRLSSLSGWTEGHGGTFEILYRKLDGYFSSQGLSRIRLNGATNSSIKQTVQVEPEKKYLLTFDYAPGTQNIDSSSVDVVVNGETVASMANPLASWSKQEVIVKSFTTSLEIVFEGTGNGGVGGLIDNVKLYPWTHEYASQNLVINGSFEESHSVANNSFQYFTSLGAWKTLSDNFISIPFKIVERQNHYIKPFDESHMLELDGERNSSAYQNVITSVGETYELKLFYSPRDKKLGQTNDIIVLIDGVQQAVLNDSKEKWKGHTFTFTANGSSSKIEFRAGGSSDGIGGLIDAVSVRKVGTSQNLIQNGSFELFHSPLTDSIGLFTSIQGWTSGTLISAEVPFEIQRGNDIGLQPREGHSKLELDSTANTKLYQDLMVFAGKKYLLELSYSASVEEDVETNKAQVLWNGTVLADLNSSVLGWNDYSFVIDGSSQGRLELRGLGISDGKGALIDAISFREIKQVSSEPPFVDFSATLAGVFPNLQILFDASATTDDQGPLSYTWRLGGPTLVESNDPYTSLNISEPGHYEVTLVVKDPDGNATFYYKKFYVTEDGSQIYETDSAYDVFNSYGELSLPPISIATVNTDEVKAGSSISFDASSSFSIDSNIVSYRYIFGDGTEVTTSSPVVNHIYETPGNMQAMVVITDANGNVSTALFSPVYVHALIPTVAILNPSSISGRAPFTVSFDGSSSTPIGQIAEFVLSFGDGTESITSDSITQHTYYVAGTYQVKLKIRETPPLTGTAETIQTITVLPKDDAPAPILKTSLAQGKAPFEVLLDGGASKDDYGIVSYTWDFKDGSATQSGPQLKVIGHTFSAPGNYQVSLKVTDTVGQVSEAIKTISVTSPATHLADFSILNAEGKYPASITFDATTPESKTDIFTYKWFVNGVEVATKKTPVLNRDFNASGTYNVTLNVTDAAGTVTTKTKSFTLDQAISGTDYLYTANTTVAGSTYQFDGSISENNLEIASFAWDFGDGAVQNLTQPNINHLYTVPGSYQVKLKTTSTSGVELERTKLIIVSPNITPIPRLTISSLSGGLGSEFTLSSTKSLDDENIVLYRLNLGDGSPVRTYTQGFSITHSYAVEKDYVISLEVEDRQGKKAQDIINYSLINPSSKPHAEFIANKLEGNPNLEVAFDASASYDDEKIVRYHWSLSNGQKFTKTTPVFNYTFTSVGTYNVSLSVEDEDGFTDEALQTVRVNTAPVPYFTASVESDIFPARLTVDASATTDDADGLTYSWMLDDGTILSPGSSSPTGEFYLSARGDFVVNLTVTDRNGLSSIYHREIRVNEYPKALAIVSPRIGEYPMTVNLNAMIASDDSGVAAYKWELVGESFTSTNALASHTFLEAGFHNFRLTVTDDEGFQSSLDYPVTVLSNPAPVASFSIDQASPVTPSVVKFDAGRSTDNRRIDIYRWDLGSTGMTQTASSDYTHTFQTAGTYPVTLTVFDDQGSSHSTTQYVSVKENTAPIANLTASSTQGEIPFVVKFDASGSSDAESGLSYLWNFGDGSGTASDKRVAHTFNTPGSYEATLTVTDAQGLSAFQSVTITVSDKSLADSQAPEVNPQITTSFLSNSEQELVFALRDFSSINYQTLRLTINDVLLNSSHFQFDESSGILRVKLSEPFALQSMTEIKVGLRVSDEHGNFLSKGFYYKVYAPSLLRDTYGPVVNFSPKGGDTQNLNSEITVGLYDFTGVDYDSILVTLNGINLPASSIIKESLNNRFKVMLAPPYSLNADALNTLLVHIKDSLGNVSLAGVGYDTRDNKIVIKSLPTFSPVGMFGTGSYHTCAQDDIGLKCWGLNNRGELGLGYSTSIEKNPSLIPYVDIAGDRAKKIYSTNDRTCIINQDDDVRCWGKNSQGSLGVGYNGDIGDNEVPGSIPVIRLGAKVKELALGEYHSCAITLNDDLVCWGYGNSGALGYGDTYFGADMSIGDDEHPEVAGAVNLGSFGKVKQVAVGSYHTCALNFLGEVKCWGPNIWSILGIDTQLSHIGAYTGTSVATAPVLNFTEKVTNISGSGTMTCAVLESKNVRCWGVNTSGSLGISSTQSFSAPDVQNAPNVSLGFSAKWVGVATRGAGACAIDESDRAKCWGLNQYEQIDTTWNNIGDDELPSSKPYLNLHDRILTLDSGSNHKCAILADNTFNCWGALGWYNDYPSDTSLWHFDDPNFRYVTMKLNGNSGSNPTLSAIVSSDFTNGEIPLAVNFDASASSSSDAAIQSYSWDFGDGSQILSTSAPLTSHTFTNAGVYQVKMTVHDVNGNEVTANTVISATNGTVLPVAKIGVTKDSGKLGDTIDFNSLSSFDPFNENLVYHWNFGDGSTLTTTDTTLAHSYQSLGLFLASLTVESADGRVSAPSYQTIFINAINELPYVQFSCTSGDYTVACLADQSVDYDGSIENYRWEMGDGEILFGKNISYTYQKPGAGKFQIKLTVTDNSGGETSKLGTAIKFDTVAPVIATNLQSNISISKSQLNYNLTIADDNNTQTTIWVNNTKIAQTDSKSVSSYLKLQNGQNSIKIVSIDGAGNQTEANFTNINAINTIPSIALSPTTEGLTNVAMLPLNFTVTDDGPTKTTVMVNNEVIISDMDDKTFDGEIELVEGPNRIEIVTYDESQQKDTKIIEGITLDTIPPRVISISPKNGSRFIGSNDFMIQGRASEELSEASIDGVIAALDRSGGQFSYQKTVEQEGDYSYSLTLTDKAGNSTTVNHSYEVLLHILYPELITVVPEGSYLRVIGKAGATRFPGQRLSVSGGWFNTSEIFSAADGSFSVLMTRSDTIDISTYHPELNFSEAHRILYRNETKLSGAVKDVTDMPLPGVKVTIISTSESAITDASGMFTINSKAAGNQEILIDGTAIPEAAIGPEKKFSKTVVNVSMGNLELNVLDRPVYLTAINLQNSVVIDPQTGGTVTSSEVPGALLEIPAESISFPTGTAVEINGVMKNVVSISKIDANKTSIEVPQFAVPSKVYALEPSGVTFSKPAKLILPNDNEFEVDTRVVFISKNSSTGRWEIDGAGAVTSSGVETLPGQGISHFSEVYAIPYGVSVTSRKNGDYPGVDTQGKGISSSIQMPSYKMMGSDITPSLLYNSQWHQPSALISNSFNLDKQLVWQRETSGVGNFVGVPTYNTNTISAWSVPQKVVSRFFIDDLSSGDVTFSAENAPKDAMVSYQFNLETLSSGVYFARAEYEFHYKQLVMASYKKIDIFSKILGAFSRNPEDSHLFKITIGAKDESLASITPPPISETVFVQNKKDSEYGAGWRLNMGQRILNPTSPKLLLEEEDGSARSYVLDNAITTILYDENGIQAADLTDSKNLRFVNGLGKVGEVDLEGVLNPLDATTDEKYDIPSYKFDQRLNLGWKLHRSNVKCASGFKAGGECPASHKYYDITVGCTERVFKVEVPKDIKSFLRADNKDFYVDSKGAFFNFSGSETHLAGKRGAPAGLTNDLPLGSFPDTVEYCKEYSIHKGACSSSNTTFQQDWERSTKQRERNFAPSFKYCNPTPDFQSPSLAGTYPLVGFSESSAKDAQFNQVTTVIPSQTEPNTFIFVDKGNHLVRKVNILSNETSILAGDRTTQGEDSPDGTLASESKIYMPRGIAQSQTGEVFISSGGDSSGKGYIWKISLDGKIARIAGQNAKAAATLTSTLPEAKFIEPAGLAIDDVNNILYVADSGNNRVVALLLDADLAVTVAGDTSCRPGVNKESQPALDASICHPTSIGIDQDQNLLILDSQNKMVKKVNVSFKNGQRARFASSDSDGSYIDRFEDGTFNRVLRDKTVIVFDSAGRHLSTSDRIGNRQEYQYDGSGRLIEVIDPRGGRSSITYSGGLVSSYSDPSGRTTTFAHAYNDLTTAYFPDSSARWFTYSNPRGVMSSEQDKLGNQYFYLLNTLGRLQSIRKPDGSVTSTESELEQTVGNNSSEDSPLESISFGTGEEGSFEYRETNVDPEGVKTYFDRDLKGFVNRITDAKGRVTEIKRDSQGRPVYIKKHDGEVVEMNYNSLGDLIFSKNTTTGIVSQLTYNTEGQVLSSTTTINFTSKSQTSEYNLLGLLEKTTDSNGLSSYRTYFPDGLLASVENDNGEVTSIEYDIRGNIYRKIAPEGENVTTERDLAGNVILKRDGKGTSTRYTYDSFNRLKSVETGITVSRPSGDITQYDYDFNGNLKQIMDPKNNVTVFQYDSLNRVIYKKSHSGQIWTYSYDSRGNVQTETDPNGVVSNFGYDSDNQLVSKGIGGNVYAMEYDIDGNLTRVSNNTSSIDYTYSKVRGEFKVTSAVTSFADSSLPSVELSYSYDSFGNRSGMITPYGQFSYVHDAGNRLRSVKNHLNQVFGFNYDSANRLVQTTRPGSVSEHQFDGNGFLKQISHNKGLNLINQLIYQRDPAGNKTKIVSSRGTSTYGYDENYQLKTVSNPEATSGYQSEFFNYDSLGNRLNDQLAAYAYDSKSARLVEDTFYQYSYDNNGNLISKTKKGMVGTLSSYIYNGENQLVEIQDFEANARVKTIQYSYDVAGRRYRKIVIDHNDDSKSFERRSVFDGNERLADYNENNSILAVHTHSTLRTDDVLATQITPAGQTEGLAQGYGSFLYLKDSLGSITDIVDESGNLHQHFVYSSFGKILKITNGAEVDVTASPVLRPDFAFTNREFDQESGMYYYRARYYVPELGRFISEDPVAGKIENPLSLNSRYSYCQNSPLRYTDPNGEFPFLVALLWTAIYSAGVAAVQSAYQEKNGGGNFEQTFWTNFGINFLISSIGLFAHGFQTSFTANYALGWGGVYSTASVARGFSLGFFQSSPGAGIGTQTYWHEVGHSINFALMNLTQGSKDINTRLGWNIGFYLFHGLGSKAGKHNPASIVSEGSADIWSSPWYGFGETSGYYGDWGYLFP